jgi:hypothetical protein
MAQPEWTGLLGILVLLVDIWAIIVSKQNLSRAGC